MIMYNCFENDIDNELEGDAVLGYNKIYIKIAHNHFCYDEQPRATEYFEITAPVITQRLAAAFLEENYQPDCNHIFLEGFDKTPGSECQFEPFFGS